MSHGAKTNAGGVRGMAAYHFALTSGPKAEDARYVVSVTSPDLRALCRATLDGLDAKRDLDELVETMNKAVENAWHDQKPGMTDACEDWCVSCAWNKAEAALQTRRAERAAGR